MPIRPLSFVTAFRTVLFSGDVDDVAKYFRRLHDIAGKPHVFFGPTTQPLVMFEP